ncbi:hypothetical protein HN51_063109 [Arachis hypogaea]|uniref:TCP domain-containing protein n=1 Tax=Arachis hypogaea TaxID=3818 RepID=A0A445AZ79_ARAHY|nr:transcription factor TCP5-like [Arachis ipaensis]XP_016193575.1 transcription factor TCP5-like [Arachis ipaensis]XP_020979754.1 transcription factor TCP5-like [Arachis ipaensis]QHO20738.1 Transcription factor [Arachis hypogaea]RYR31743.1 hypothetical protein Ahy_B01g056632 [Arachis hypogaea]
MSSSKSSYEAKQEDEGGGGTSSSRQWTAFRNPRIVRVSRSLGGKDRHSKVCTIRGLRDRRIRLSVPTAIQLYDLQDRLGLGQPSKVIDWLLQATKLDIDKLPPLQIPPGFAQFHHHQTLIPLSHHHQFSLGGFYDANSTRFWDLDSSSISLKGKESDTITHPAGVISEKGKWIKTNQHVDENQDGLLLLNNAMGYNSPSGLTLSSSSSSSQFGSHALLFPSQQLLDPHSSNGVPQFSSSSATTPSTFTPYYAPFLANSSSSTTTTMVENNSDALRQFNHIQILSSQVMPHPFIPSSSLLHSINSNNNNDNNSAAATIRRIPMPFSSKLLDSDNNNNESNQEDHKGT